MHKLGEIMTIVMTPLGALELNIPTIYGSKHQFRSYGGDVFDIPDWLGWAGLIFGLVAGGAIGGIVAWKARGVFNVAKTGQSVLTGVLGTVSELLTPEKTAKKK